jgi:prolyl oligopeptidase
MNAKIAFCGALLAALVAGMAAAAPADDDPFRFLEDGTSREAQAFFGEQGANARLVLDRIPGRAAMLDRIRALSQGGGAAIPRIEMTATRIFYLRNLPAAQTPVLCMREGLAGAEKVLLDPARFSRPPARAAIDWFAPSPDGRHLAYGVSLGGSEDAVLRVLDVEALRDLPFEIDRARFNDALAWHPDSRAFYYARTPEGNRGARRNANVRLYRHVLGRETAKDEIVFASGAGGARDVPEFVFPSLHLPLESRYAYAVVREGVRREVAVHVAEQRDLAAGKPRWRKLAGFEDEVLAIEGWRDELYLLSRRGAPRHKVLRVKAAAELATARVAVPEGDAVIESMALARDALYLRTMVAGVDRLERLGISLLGSRAAEYVRTPFDNSISQLVAHPRVEGAILAMQGWIDAPQVVQVDRHGNLHKTSLQPPAAADYSAIDEVRLYAPGHDGVKIPVTLVYRKGTTLTRQNPTLLTAYGSYGVSLRPDFTPARLAWLERGGVIAMAHVRGGGEYGEGWREAGARAKKINTILDLVAAAEFLQSYGFTDARHLAIMGTSAGGIPVGGALVRRPELFAAVIARVPVMDMLRYEFAASGPSNIPEFGSIATPAGLEALRVMSAYRLVKDCAPYPGVLMTAGLNDPRVDAWQPGKMVARLQGATTSGKPVLLRVDATAGHGQGATRAQRDEELADIYSFALWQFGDPQFQPEPTDAQALPAPNVHCTAPAASEAPPVPPKT